jgi:hypothetical protein
MQFACRVCHDSAIIELGFPFWEFSGSNFLGTEVGEQGEIPPNAQARSISGGGCGTGHPIWAYRACAIPRTQARTERKPSNEIK